MDQNISILDFIRTESRTISLEVILDYLSKVLLFRITTRSAGTYMDYPQLGGIFQIAWSKGVHVYYSNSKDFHRAQCTEPTSLALNNFRCFSSNSTKFSVVIKIAVVYKSVCKSLTRRSGSRGCQFPKIKFISPLLKKIGNMKCV